MNMIWYEKRLNVLPQLLHGGGLHLTENQSMDLPWKSIDWSLSNDWSLYNKNLWY